MILALALALADPAPEVIRQIAHSMEDYVECLHVIAGRPDREAAVERARLAISQCHSRRDAVTQMTISLLAPGVSPDAARARSENALAMLDRLFPDILAEGGGVEIPRPIAPMVRRYTDCLAHHMEQSDAYHSETDEIYQAAVVASISGCAAVRSAGLAEAETVLSADPAFADAQHRREAIANAFDQTDANARNLPAMMGAISLRQGAHASN